MQSCYNCLLYHTYDNKHKWYLLGLLTIAYIFHNIQISHLANVVVHSFGFFPLTYPQHQNKEEWNDRRGNPHPKTAKKLSTAVPHSNSGAHGRNDQIEFLNSFVCSIIIESYSIILIKNINNQVKYYYLHKEISYWTKINEDKSLRNR